jgi:hypothetical protein
VTWAKYRQLTRSAGNIVGNIWTSADVRNGTEETEVSTASVGSGTRIFAQLLLPGNGPYLHQSLQAVTQNGSLLASRFVHTFDRLAPPVGPVQKSAQLSQAKGVSGTLYQLNSKTAT